MIDPPLIYVAGPFTAATRDAVEANIKHAVDWAVRVAEIGGMPVCPHSNTADPRFELAQSYPFWIAGTMGLLRACHAILLIPGWENSAGARGERDEMLRLIRPVFVAATEWEKLKRWIGPAGRGAE
jgi:hypothetical protein